MSVMRKIMMKAVMLLAAVSLFTACNEPVVWDDSVGLVGFTTTMVTVAEGEAAQLGIFFSAPTGAEAIEVNLAVSTAGIPVPATEGVDYTLSSKTLNLEIGSENITVTAADDDVFTGNRSFYITIASAGGNYPTAIPGTIKVIIIEDEHPLTQWIGTYVVTAVSHYDPGNLDEEWTVTTDVVPTDPYKLQIRGIGAAGSGPVVATLDPETMTIEMDSNQALGMPYGSDYGNISIYYATDDLLNNSGWPVTPEMLTTAAAIKITGTLSANGNIEIDRFAEIMVDDLFSYDTFTTTWIKQ